MPTTTEPSTSTTIAPAGSAKAASTLENIRELIRYRDLLFTLALRDIKVRYRQTFMGVAWAIIQPLSFMVIFTVLRALLFSQGSDVANEASGGVPYPIFSYVALVPWMFFTNAVTASSNSVAVNMNLVKKIYFPREVFPMGSTLGTLMDFCVASLIVGGMMLYYRIPLQITILWAPLLVAIQVLFILSVAFFFSAMNVFYRDIKYIIPLMIQLGMFVTPVIYSASMVPEKWRTLYMLNPMAVVIEGMRKIVIDGQHPDLALTLGMFGAMFIFFALAYRFFKKAEVKFADLI